LETNEVSEMKSPEVLIGECSEILRNIQDESIDACVTDPPYGLKFMGEKWDHGVPSPIVWREVLRVLKPGAHLLSFGGSRMYHRMAVAIEDAGFEIRDQIMWIYGSGFPKSSNQDGDWKGWGTALKPAHEPIVVARKPLDGTVAQNLARWGVGALNIDGCRVELSEGDDPRLGGKGDWSSDKMAKNVYEGGYAGVRVGSSPLGRWPANVIHDGSDEVLAAFPHTASGTGAIKKASSADGRGNVGAAFGAESRPAGTPMISYGDEGSAARFFYCAKASRAERGEGNDHPTVKPLALMEYLIKLITPPGGVVIDPFAGSGSTLLAAQNIGMHSIGIELSSDYVRIIKSRLGIVSEGEIK
jgi:site-specific DNA-methyltransferase (adenine-specific)